MFRKALTFILTLAVLTGLLAGTAVAQESATIRYFTFSAAPDHLEDLDAIIAAFEAENPITAVRNDYSRRRPLRVEVKAIPQVQ